MYSLNNEWGAASAEGELQLKTWSVFKLGWYRIHILQQRKELMRLLMVGRR